MSVETRDIVAPAPPKPARQGGFARFARNKGALVGLLILLAILAVALIGPFFYTNSPWRMVGRPFLAPFAMDRFPSAPTRSAATWRPGSSMARASRC